MSCITEILRIKGDKEVLLPLNKNGEPWIAVEGGGKYKEYEYLIVLNQNAHRCGYVAIPPNHPANDVGTRINTYTEDEEFNYDELDIDCHGGLTFGGNHHGLKELLSVPCTDNWIGFDCGHCYDHCDSDAFIKYYGEEKAKEKESFFNVSMIEIGGSVKSFEYVERECKKIINQLIEKESN